MNGHCYMEFVRVRISGWIFFELIYHLGSVFEVSSWVKNLFFFFILSLFSLVLFSLFRSFFSFFLLQSLELFKTFLFIFAKFLAILTSGLSFFCLMLFCRLGFLSSCLFSLFGFHVENLVANKRNRLD